MKLLFSPTPTQEKILFALARHKFLTTSQFLRLGASSTQSNLSRAFRELKTRKLLAVEGFAQPVREGNKHRYKKLESFYYLTKRGAEIVMERLDYEPEKVKYPKGKANFFNLHYWHRKYTIDCEIEAIFWAKSKGYEVQISDREFDKAGSNRNGKGHAKTKIPCSNSKYIIPDANFVLFNGTDHKLFTLELHHKKSARVIANQLVNHVYALKNGGVGLHYGINKLHRILNVFIDEPKMKIVMGHLSKMDVFEEMEQFFIFKHIGQIIPDKHQDPKNVNNICNFYDEWVNFKNEIVNVL